MSSGYTYFAFISYKHEDQKWAKWLKHRLQSYRLPSRTHRAHVELPRRLVPVFYDTNLRPGPLDRQIRSEVQTSKYLIVLCSRAAQREPEWLNKEIDFFLEGGGDRSRIIPVIVDEADDPVAETFPSRLAELNGEEAILGVSVPLSGRKGAVLKIVSSMQDLRIEELESEDKKRRKKNTLLTTACLVLAAGAAVLGILQFRAVSRARAAEEAAKYLEMSTNALNDGERKNAVRYALNAMETFPDEDGKQKAEYALAEALHVYGTDVFVQTGKIETDDYYYGVTVSEDGSVILLEHMYDDVTACSADSLETIWTAKADGLGIVDGRLYFSLSGEITETDFRNGQAVRTVTDADEKAEIDFYLHANGSGEIPYSPDRQWRLQKQNGSFTIQGKAEGIQVSCAGEYYDAAFADSQKVIYVDREGIRMVDLDSRETTRVLETDPQMFQFPVRILAGKERILCILNGAFYCLDCEGNVLTRETAGQRHDRKGGIAAACWLDAEESTAIWFGCDGRASVAGPKELDYYWSRQIGMEMNRRWLSAWSNTDHPDCLVFKSDTDAFTAYVYRKLTNDDARLVAACVPEGFQYETAHNGTYIFRSNSLDHRNGEIHDLIRTADGEIIWTDRDRAAADPENRIDMDYYKGLSQDGGTLYFYDAALRMADNQVIRLSEALSAGGCQPFRTAMLASDGKQPTIHAALYCPEDAAPEMAVYEELEEKWRVPLPLDRLAAGAEGTYQYSLTDLGENGWMAVICDDGNAKTPILIDVFRHRITVAEPLPASFYIWTDICFGAAADEPVAAVFTEGRIRMIRCTDGKTVRSFASPAGSEEIMTYPIMNDSRLLVHAMGTNTLYILDAESGETLYRGRSRLEPFQDLDLTFAADERYIYYVLTNRLEGDIQDGYRIDTQTWTVDRHFPMADTFLPSLGRVICMDDAELKRYSYPAYTREELKKKAEKLLAR